MDDASAASTHRQHHSRIKATVSAPEFAKTQLTRNPLPWSIGLCATCIAGTPMILLVEETA